ncbi:alpha/beta hydrolase-fold protein [Staphylococcus sp. SQ8-PEA]|uniref:Alpha/beta hydrolase-fold protein n=1 Tax=Staphylococcus marylandisciuri TaxID=2981529 RepID=A0ABT2QPV2_9STAP|nr:alpha/beta hydrolase-fold protein [Staphylococcus marylandisciuri]MCU5746004.1 alpha/beta hydrolase-fold protein [Staphylococcus marylandisciuri]
MTEFQPGKITTFEFPSDILNRNITLSVYLPKDYTELFKHKVVICFDGRDFFSFGQVHRKYEKLRKEEKIEKAIFIGFHYQTVDDRRREFHPQGDKAPQTVRAVTQELLPFIDNTFATYKVGHGRVLLGDSLAGSIALLTALSYPRIFSQVGVLSPQYAEPINQLVERCQFKEQLSIWHAVGLEEQKFNLPTTGAEADFLTPNRALHELLDKHNITTHYQEFEGGHQWKSWQGLLEDLLIYFLSDDISF